MIVTCVNNLELQGGGRKGEMELDIGIFAPGYAIHYVLFLLLFILVVVSSFCPPLGPLSGSYFS
jgi:hypothetical protein